MKNKQQWISTMLLAVVLSACTSTTEPQPPQKTEAKTQSKKHMKLNAGIITEKLAETKDFYCNKLGFGVTFENDFYLLLHTPGHTAEISFLLPDHPTQQPVFKQAFDGRGVYLTIELDDVDAFCERLMNMGIQPAFPLRDEPWGDRHFAVTDPNGVNIDFVKYSPPQQ
jgi:catechol 2,3-dioxygenase-like lactoylglutathione lyase family enzyme